MRRLIELLKGPAAVYLGASVLARAASFLLIPLYTRRLSLEEYGDYALFLTLLTFLSTFMSFGLSAALPKVYFSSTDRVEGRARAAGVARWLVMLTMAFAAVLVLGVWIIAPDSGVDLLSRRSLILAVTGGAGMAIGAVPWTLLRAEQKAYRAAAFQLSQFVAVTGAGLLLVAVLDRGYSGAVEAAAGGQVFAGLLGLAYVLLLPSSRRTTDIREAMSFSLPFVPHFVAQWLQGAADRWVLRAFGFDAELGGYSLAVQVVSPVNMVTQAWNDSVAPTMGEHYRTGGVLAFQSKIRGVLRSYLWAIAVPGALLTLALPVIALLVGEEFRDALLMVPFVVAALIPDAVYYTYFHVVYYAGRSRALSAATVAGAAVNVGANCVLVPLFGAWGAILARLLSGAVRAGIVGYTAGDCLTSADHPGNRGDSDSVS